MTNTALKKKKTEKPSQSQNKKNQKTKPPQSKPS